MLSHEKRKLLVIKYLKKYPLSNFRQIRMNHSKHEYHSRYLHEILDKLMQEKKIDMFMKRYYAFPDNSKEINLMINIIKNVSLTKPIFKKLTFDETLNNPTIETMMKNCICLYHIKLKINNFEGKLSKRLFDSKFIALLKQYSDDDYYHDALLVKGYLKKNPWQVKFRTHDTLEKRILNFLLHYWIFSYEYYQHWKNNKIPFGEIFNRLFKQQNEGKSTTARNIGITNKGLKRSLDRITGKYGLYKDVLEFDPEMIVMRSSRSRILDTGLAILGHRTPSKRRKYAKIWEEISGIPFTKLIPLKGYSQLLKEAQK